MKRRSIAGGCSALATASIAARAHKKDDERAAVRKSAQQAAEPTAKDTQYDKDIDLD